MLLLINPSMQNLVELYTVFKKYEQIIEKVYELFQKTFFKYKDIMEPLKEIVDNVRASPS